MTTDITSNGFTVFYRKYSEDLMKTLTKETATCEKITFSLETRGTPDEIGSGP